MRKVRSVRLPEFDRTMKPTIRREWMELMPRRSMGFWWRVGCVVRIRRVRHKDHEKIRKICAAVDAAHPEHRRFLTCWLDQQVCFVLR